ncbi:hypothetical protein ACWDY7_18500 [Streptomyces calvus]|uniref:Tetratricopeptide (TPR) repeat protein n=1 Tax=Streptomyces calvus TaxID=67282 RepID=A0AA40SF85_9ACTN|nr:hypothetical protein [Streptomyces calvus]MBA8945417.1 tetratricopeptide (TPR) repeat protein [Streptomyces calvus]
MTARVRNEVLARTVREAGYSYAELARHVRALAEETGPAVRTNSSAVAHWVAGTRPAERTADLVAEVLSRRLGRPVTALHLGLRAAADGLTGLPVTPDELGDPLEELVLLGRADIGRSPEMCRAPYSDALARLPLDLDAQSAARAGARRAGAAGDSEVRAVREMTELFTAVDERHGGQHGRSALVQYLVGDVAPLCRARFRTERAEQQMLSAAACAVYLAGWKAYDAGEQGLAQRYYLQSYRLTQEAGNELHGAFVLRVLAHHGMETGRAENALALIDAALDRVRGRTDPATEALYVVTRARALAMEGRRRDAVSAAARAARLVEDADERDMPYWAALWGSAKACVGNHTAKAAEAMGSYDIAEQHFSHAVWNCSGTAYQRIAALSVAHVGSMQCRQGLVEQACATWEKALDLMEGVRSARVRRAVTAMSEDLAPYRGRRVAAALALEERIVRWKAQETR